MAKNNIELSIGSTFNGDGFKRLDTALKSSATSVRKVSSATSQIALAMEGAGGSIGKASGIFNKFVGAFAQGGAWGLAISGITSFVMGWKKAHDKMVQFHKDFAKSARDVESALAKQLQMRQKLDKQEMEDFKKKIRQKIDATHAYRDFEKKDSLEEASRVSKIQQLEVKSAGLDYQSTGNELDDAKFEAQQREKIARIVLEEAKKKEKITRTEGSSKSFREMLSASLEVAQAEYELKKVLTENKKTITEIEKRQKDAADELEKENVKRIEAEKKIAEAKVKEANRAEARDKVEKENEASAKKVAELDDKIAAAKLRATELEENAARARGGKTFGEWQRGERQRERDQSRSDARQKNVINNAEKEIAQLESEQKRFGRGFSKQRASRLAKLREFVADQDPKNNPALKEAERLEKEKMELIKKTKENIDDIAKTLKDGVAA